MPAENMEEQGLEKNPNLKLSQIKFLLSLEEYKNDPKLEEQLLSEIKEGRE